MICTNCKSQVSDKSIKCPSCGTPVIQFEFAPVSSSETVPVHEKTRVGAKILQWLFFATFMTVAISVVVICTILYGVHKGSSWRSIVLAMHVLMTFAWWAALYGPDRYRSEQNRTLTGKGKVVQAVVYIVVGFFLFIFQGGIYFEKTAYRLWTSNGIYEHLAGSAKNFIEVLQIGNIAFLILSLVHTFFDKTLQFANTWNRFWGFFKRKKD